MSYDLTDPEEVKKYVENLGIEYRFGCYSEKDPEICHLLGEYMEAFKEDYNKADKIFKANCDDNNHPRSCQAYATHCFLGKGQPKPDFGNAYKYFVKACDSNQPVACFNAGLMHMTDDPKINQGRDYTKGLAYIEKSCSMKDALSCYYLSGVYLSGSKDQVIKKDMAAAFKYSEKACDLGNIQACSNLSLMYKRGDGVQQDLELSEKFKKKVVELQEERNVQLEFQRGWNSTKSKA